MRESGGGGASVGAFARGGAGGTLFGGRQTTAGATLFSGDGARAGARAPRKGEKRGRAGPQGHGGTGRDPPGEVSRKDAGKRQRVGVGAAKASVQETEAVEAKAEAEADGGRTALQRWTEEVSVQYPFETNYLDHFESPARAYEDLAPLLRRVAVRLHGGNAGEASASERDCCDRVSIYDPFYCDGAVVDRLANVGFPNVTHACVDFYAALKRGRVPAHDVVVTNPPYSGDHKERALKWAVGQGKPWFQLLPNYVATKGYFASLFPGTASPTPASVEPVVFLVPTAKYEFEHPEGTGKDASPFFSVWFCGGLARADLAGLERELGPDVKLVTSVKAMGDGGHLRVAKRGNPKQRRKARLAAQGAA